MSAAVVVTATARFDSETGSPSSSAALQTALSNAIKLIAARHLSAEERKSRDRELNSFFYSQQSKYVVRYSVVSEVFELGGDEAGEKAGEIEIEAEVDKDKLLAAFIDRGFHVRQMSADPRIAIMPTQGASATPAARGLKDELEKRGFRARIIPVEKGLSENEASAIAGDLGCHIALFISVEEKSTKKQAPQHPSDIEFSEKTPIMVEKRSVAVTAQVVDASDESMLGEFGDEASGQGPDRMAAFANAASYAGKKLAEPLIALLEQWEWSPGQYTAENLISIKGLTSPQALEELQKELLAITEVQTAELKQIGYQSAVWAVTSIDSGISWDALLSTVKLSKGRLLAVYAPLSEEQPSAEPIVNAMWVKDE